MNKYMHKATLHLAKAVLCMVMLFILIILLLLSLSYPNLVMTIMLVIAIISGMTSAQLGYFVGNVIRGNNNETR